MLCSRKKDELKLLTQNKESLEEEYVRKFQQYEGELLDTLTTSWRSKCHDMPSIKVLIAIGVCANLVSSLGNIPKYDGITTQINARI